MNLSPQAFDLYKQQLTDAGIADTRQNDLCVAMDNLHAAFCDLDSSNRALFAEFIGSKTLIDSLREFAESNPFANADF
jgi:hypothetical protein|tara:strand:+ start:958 stop:1191 length:234 start_codon:yes stop_codon:yes gene_type:complete